MSSSKKSRKAELKKFQKIFGVARQTANLRLLRLVAFEFFKQNYGSKCFRCSGEVNPKEFSIDHMDGYWDADDPVDAYMDFTRCRISHNHCNAYYGHSERLRLQKERLNKMDRIRGMFNGSTRKARRSSGTTKRLFVVDTRTPAKETDEDQEAT